MKKKLILDVDTGVDDAQAIMVALAAPDVEILAITCCHGNTPLQNVCKNTLRVLKVCDRLDVSRWLTVTGVSTEIGSYCMSVHCFIICPLSPTILHRSQCIAAAQSPCWLIRELLEITTGKTDWARSRIQTLQAWSCCRREKVCRP